MDNTFTNASVIEQACWQMRLADFPRAQNRARIAALFDGNPPYSSEEERTNNIAINVNWLEGTKLAHDARQQFTNALLKPGKYFTARSDMGPAHKRQERGTKFTLEINRIMKRSPLYFETMRSKFAMLVLHGIAPSNWETPDYWCPDALGVEDIMIPSGTRLTMKNLPFFAIYRAYTAAELWRLTHGPKVDPGWQMDNVTAAIKWADAETAKLSGTTWPEVWSPDKMEQRIKEDSGLYASDAVPVISAWDFFWYNDSKHVEGWNRRIVLDAFGQPGIGGVIQTNKMPDRNILGGNGQFLYNPGDRKYGSSMREIVQFQFGDLSAVAPFRYHSVRSLGFMLYAVCHVQNRLRCKFNEAVFEGLMMYMRVKSMDEAERALKIDLISRGIIEESVQFLPPNERWQVNEQLAQMGLMLNSQVINDNSASFVQNQNYSKPDVEKTAFQVRSELQATQALLSAALIQAYQYQAFEYYEILRRFCRKDSRDPDVREFRLRCLKGGVPESMMVPEAWEIEPERVMGSGNKTLEMASAEILMQWRPLYAPKAQQEILRTATLAVTDDPGLTNALVPEAPETTDSVHDAMVAMGTLMLGLPVKFTDKANRFETTETLLQESSMIVGRIMQEKQGMATMEEIVGLSTVFATIEEQIALIEADKNERAKARRYQDALAQLQNEVKGMAQRLAEQMKAQQQQAASGNGQMDPEAMAKIQAQMMQAQVKAQNAEKSHSQKTAQRQVSWEAEESRKQQQAAFDLQKQKVELASDVAAKGAQTAAEIQMEKAKAAAAPKQHVTTE